MKQGVYKTRALVVTILIGVTALFVWAWQNISVFIQKGIADGKSIRVSENNTCLMTESESNKPHFSGCNSIL